MHIFALLKYNNYDDILFTVKSQKNEVPDGKGDAALVKKLDTMYLKALEGFFMLITKEGDILYLSDNVAKYLGLTQVSYSLHAQWFLFAKLWFYMDHPSKRLFFLSPLF